MVQNEIVEVSTTSNDRKTNRHVLVASLSIQKVRLDDGNPKMYENGNRHYCLSSIQFK
jgi:hypothetical protein